MSRKNNPVTEASELPRLKISQKLSELALQNSEAEKSFDLRTTNLKMPSYNALTDRHLRPYFYQETVKKHIKKMSTLGDSNKNMKLENVQLTNLQKQNKLSR